MNNFNLTPSPALLDMLGRIPFKGYQCIAELIDNSIDAIIANEEILKDEQRIIRVTIPTKSKLDRNEPIVIEDWGVGMTETELENSVRAGFSSKSSNTTLGLFGMGFNVATSKLANCVQVWTSTKDMSEEVGVLIDLQEMKRTGTFDRPKRFRSKNEGKTSGTQIHIYNFKPDGIHIINPPTIQRDLKRVYSKHLFNKHRIKIFVNDTELQPYEFCIWNKHRSIRHNNNDVPVYIDINHKFGDEFYCNNCFNWQNLNETVHTQTECPYCGNVGNYSKKSIEVKGWVGIQRFSDEFNYGIDISRNGRVLSKLDKTFFSWSKSTDSRFNPEYPRDTTYAGGRIVGQLDVNFVVPNYTKDNFDRTDPNWNKVVNFLRGEGPLQPELAKEQGFAAPNTSPIAILFNAFRKINVPGVKTFCMANANGGVDHTTPRMWATEFFNSNIEYEDDTIWWEAVIKSDVPKTVSTFNPLQPIIYTKSHDVDNPNGGVTKSNDKPVVYERYPGDKKLLRSYIFDIEKHIGQTPIEIDLYDYSPSNQVDTPLIFESRGTMLKFNVYAYSDHPLFNDFSESINDLLFMEVAAKYAMLINSDKWPITRLFYLLKSIYDTESIVSVGELLSKSQMVIRNVQNLLTSGLGFKINNPPELDSTQLNQLRRKYTDINGASVQDVKALTSNTMFLGYMDIDYLFNFIRDYPAIIYDGHVFNLPYLSLDDSDKQDQLAKYTSYITDLKWFVNVLPKESDHYIKTKKQEIIRNSFCIHFLNEHLVKKI